MCIEKIVGEQKREYKTRLKADMEQYHALREQSQALEHPPEYIQFGNGMDAAMQFAAESLKKVTDANPQQKQILWGSGELIHYRNADGAQLEAALSLVHLKRGLTPRKRL